MASSCQREAEVKRSTLRSLKSSQSHCRPPVKCTSASYVRTLGRESCQVGKHAMIPVVLTCRSRVVPTPEFSRTTFPVACAAHVTRYGLVKTKELTGRATTFRGLLPTLGGGTACRAIHICGKRFSFPVSDRFRSDHHVELPSPLSRKADECENLFVCHECSKLFFP
jgi:hypothetical protein